ncbi:MAG: MFS transporter, partial [Marinomonas sp.]
AEIAPEAAEGFGLWSFVSKLSLAFAAAVLLPLLDAAGLQSGVGASPEAALATLTFFYAILPCFLKLAALALLAATPLEEDSTQPQLNEV